MMTTSNLELVDPKIIPFEAIRRTKEEVSRLGSYVDYLTVLKTEELLIEVKDIIRKLSSEETSRELIVKGKLVLSEISARLNFSSPTMSLAVKKFQRELDHKINDLEKLFVIKL